MSDLPVGVGVFVQMLKSYSYLLFFTLLLLNLTGYGM